MDQQKFLNKILKLEPDAGPSKIDADKIYDAFITEGEGSVEFFAKRIVETNTDIEDIRKNVDLINKLGNIYGANSAKISELLTHGMANVRYKEEAFFASAEESLKDENYGDPEIWIKLDANSGSWDEKQAKIKEAERIAAEKLQKEQEAAEKKRQEEGVEVKTEEAPPEENLQPEAREKEVYKKEAVEAVKFIKELKEGKMEIKDALEYIQKLSDLKDGNGRYFDSFIYYEMGTEIESPKLEDEGKGRVNSWQKERALIIDNLIDKAKQECGDDVNKQNEYRQKIMKVFNIFSARKNDYGYYLDEGKRENIVWLDINSTEKS